MAAVIHIVLWENRDVCAEVSSRNPSAHCVFKQQADVACRKGFPHEFFCGPHGVFKEVHATHRSWSSTDDGEIDIAGERYRDASAL